MSYDAFSKNDGQNEGGNNLPQNNQNPYGGSSETPSSSPYAAPQQSNSPYFSDPAGLPSTPPPNAYPPQQNSPYGYNQAPASNDSKGFTIFGLTWQKNIVPNPQFNGAVPSNKSAGIAYVLWFFLGWCGVHQFYLGNSSRGLFNLVLWAATGLVSLIGLPVGLIFTAYWIYEAVTLNDQTKEINNGHIRKSIL